MDDLAEREQRPSCRVVEDEPTGTSSEQGHDLATPVHETVKVANSKSSLPSSRSFEQQRRLVTKSQTGDRSTGCAPDPSQQRGRLGPVKSLESASGSAGDDDDDDQQLAGQSQDLGQLTRSKKSTSSQHENKQLFGLRQLALPSSRTLTSGGTGRGKKQDSSVSPASSTQVQSGASSAKPLIQFKLKVQNSFTQPSGSTLASAAAAAATGGKSRATTSGGGQKSSHDEIRSYAGQTSKTNHAILHEHEHTSSGSYSFDDSNSSSFSDSEDDENSTSEEDDESCFSEGDRKSPPLKSAAGESDDVKGTALGNDQNKDRHQKGSSGKMRQPELGEKPGQHEAPVVTRKGRRRRSRARRTSCCQCEPIINRIDFDCQPVTDVDLVTYKHLCQLEQKQQQLRAHQRRGGRRAVGGLTGAQSLVSNDDMSTGARFAASYRHNLQAALAHGPSVPSGQSSACGGGGRSSSSAAGGSSQQQQQLKRRSSLQEESGAYYQLCTTAEEQAIRAKYVWFPPSLRSVALVDQFFSYFPKDKIPYNLATCRPTIVASQQVAQPTTASKKNSPSEGGTSSPQDSKPAQVTTTAQQVAASGLLSNNNVESLPQQQQQQVSGNTSTSASAQPQPASSLACASYRDEQISFQLPRQDISLDYCSYHMSESSRSSYLQFVDKRNSQSLDVGSVIQIELAGGETKTKLKQQAAAVTRKQSSASQVVVMGAANPSDLALAANVPGDRALATQRCRRCLVRFEDQQLAVVAPNFAIGTPGPYHAGHAHAADKAAGTLEVLLASGTSATSSVPRRNSISVQQTPKVPTLDENFASPGTIIQSQEQQNSKRALTTTAKQHLAMFHPSCFTCATCKEFLVDLVYCLREGKLYCLRHYGESLRPRCSWCQELIFSDEYLKAMNENFHVDHFLCRHCDSNLAGHRYVLKEEKPYCIGCYEQNFANTCEECQKAIGIDSRDLSYKERHWHDTCFLCQQCQQSLIDKPFGSKGDKVYCADCYDTSFATRCDGCKNPFRAGSKKMEYRGRQWHDSCFCCCVCQNTIGSNSFIPKNEEIYCIKCYEDKYATRCTKCKQVIVSGGVTFRNEPWHRECFNCCNCNKSLAGQRFTTKDVTSETTGASNLNKTNQPHNAYCIDCYGELFAKKCFACSQAITGLGGTRFVTFEDRSWHNDCFICSDCQTTLVGKGFITDGPDTILCGDCARAKLR